MCSTTRSATGRLAGWREGRQGAARANPCSPEQPGRVFSRDQLLDKLHDDGRAVRDRLVDSHIRNLRRKFEAAPGGLNSIRSVYGVVYAFEWPVG